MDQAVADAIRTVVESVTDNEDAYQEALIAAWRGLLCGMPLKRVCRLARAVAEGYVEAEQVRREWEVPVGLFV